MTQTLKHHEGKTLGGIYYRKTSCKHQTNQTLVLVMGYGGSLRIWPESFVDKLAENYDVITYDNRGTGLSFLPEDESAYTTQSMAGDLEEVVNPLGIERFHMLGYSMGGCIAIEYALQYTPKVQSLFLLSTTGGGSAYTRPDKALSTAMANPQGKTLWEIYQFTFALMYSPESYLKVEPKLKEIYEAAKFNPTRPKALLGHSNAFKYFDAAERLSKLTMPVTVLTGAEDRLMPPENSQALHRAITNSTLVVVPGCEHGVHIEMEDLVVSEIGKLTARAAGLC
ncbi:MAG: alpha/beta hydrolase [Cyanobacteria bacterium SZAS TMP-1]|nr:alpha/beta hydrolase [Cyanobacteria bacterium SZAS TMP-1]